MAEIKINSIKFGGGNFPLIAGPCSVESEEQIVSIAREIKKIGADILRGGAFKPRTSPHDFQGLGKEGLKFLSVAKAETGLPTVSEILKIEDMEDFFDVDILQIGARNMQNFELLKEIGQINKPVLLKRGFGNTLKELLMSAEYIMENGNERVILCERGIRSFNEDVRYTLDLSAVPLLHSMTKLPVIVDPSHGTGAASLVEPMALAAAACGADGLMVEVHNNPAAALSDGFQALTPREYGNLIGKVKSIRNIVYDI